MRPRGYRKIALLACLSLMAAGPAWNRMQAADDVVMKAMRDELARSMEKLRIEKLDKPYFIAYRVQETRSMTASASFGSLLAGGENRVRSFSVELRVGDYSFDNTNFLSMPSGPFGSIARLPLEDDYQELRRQMWLVTDATFKKAVEDLGKKRSALQNRTRTEEVPDFSKEQPSTTTDEPPPAVVTRADAEKLVRELSALFREVSQVDTSRVSYHVGNTRRRYVNSEGTSYTRTASEVTFTALAGAQAPDGMPLEDFVTAYGHSPADLPKKEELAARIREVGARLAKLREAPLLERYNGPVLFEGQAAAELFAQVFAQRLMALRRPITDNPQMERMAAQAENPFLDKLGARVLPDFLSVADNPARAEFQKIALAGAYKVDDDGIPARETKLVERGILLTLLAGRDPVRGITQSTGNRRGSGVLPSNLFVTAEKGVSDKELDEQLLKLVRQRGKEYGIVVRRLGNPQFRITRDLMPSAMTMGEETPVEGPISAYKVFLDGHEELIRNAAVSGLNPASFKDIVAVAATPTVYSAPFSVRGSAMPFPGFLPGDSGATVVSFVVPSMLFEDVTLTKPRGEIPKPPVAKHPFFDR